MNTHFDAIIIGGGLIGTSLALALAEQPLKVCLIEATAKDNINAGQSPKAITLSLSSVNILATIGVWKLLEPFTHPVKYIHVSDQGHFGATKFKAEDQKLAAFGYVIPALKLFEILAGRLAQQTTIEIIRPAKLEALKYSDRLMHIQVQTENGQLDLSTELLVAADGTHSKVRQLSNIGVENHSYHQSALIAQVEINSDEHSVAYERFPKNGAIALLPLKKSCYALIWSVPTSLAKTMQIMTDAEFLKLLQKEFGYRLGRFTAISQRQLSALHSTQAKTLIKPGCVLLGNAAHTIHPVAAQGFNLGLRDVATLAEVITTAKTQNKNIGDLSVLEEYQQWRKQDQRNTSGFSHSMTKLFMNDNRLLAPIRGIGLAGLNILPALKNSFAKRRMGMAGKLTKLASRIKL